MAYKQLQPFSASLSSEVLVEKTQDSSSIIHLTLEPPKPTVRQRIRERPVLDQERFDKKHGYRRVDLTLGRRIAYNYKQVNRWVWKDWQIFLMNRLPITIWLSNYKSDWLLMDLIGGIMCAIMSVPQGLAYGYMVGVPPNYGLLTGIFGPIVYAILGTSRHTSPGAFAIVSLMVGAAVNKYAVSSPIPYSATDADLSDICCHVFSPTPPAKDAIRVATMMTLLVGIFQIVFALLNMGLLAFWLSDQLVQGLTSGAAIHVLTSQIKSMTGIDGLPPTNEPFSIVNFYVCLIRQIHNIHWPTLTVALVSVFLLLFSSYAIDPILKKYLRVKFPMELFLIIGSTLLVFSSQGTKYKIDTSIVKDVKSGLVQPTAPSHSQWLEMVGDAITTAIISFVVHISLAKMIAKKLNYEINANQEWLALGTMHLFSSFFGCFAGGSSLGRSMTQLKFGVKTQLSTLICAVILLIFVYGAATLIYYLPKAVLAAIVVVAMKDLYIQLVRYFRVAQQSYVDFLIYLVTLLTVTFINVMYGLIIGVCFALLSVVFRTQWAESTCMGRIPGTADFKGIGHYKDVEEVTGVRIFRFDSPLYFANAEMFIIKCYQACEINPVQIKADYQETLEKEEKIKSKMRVGISKNEVKRLIKDPLQVRIREDGSVDTNVDNFVHLSHIIIDCSCIPYVDLMGIQALAQISADYESINIVVFFAGCKVTVRQTFEETNFYGKVPKTRMFTCVYDAVIQAQREMTKSLRTSNEKPKESAKWQERSYRTPLARSPLQKSRRILLMKDDGMREEEEEKNTQVDVTTSNTAIGIPLGWWEKIAMAPLLIHEEKSQDSMDKTQ